MIDDKLSLTYEYDYKLQENHLDSLLYSHIIIEINFIYFT